MPAKIGVLFFLMCLSFANFSFAQDVIDEEFGELESSSDAVTTETKSLSFENEALTPTSYGDAGTITTPVNPQFVKPPGPKKGGVLKVPHPNAAKGLLRIEKDGSYLYKTSDYNKNKAVSIRVGASTPPTITGPGGVSFGDIYGTGSLVGVLGEFEWQPFRGFLGAFGVQLGSGFVTSRGNGRFADRGLAQEIYDLYVIPVSAFLVYRFEYMRRQWFVPYVNGGGILYGLYEKRDDAKPGVFASSPAVGFGGGIHLSISRWDQAGAFTLQKEYGVSDLWLTGEIRIVQGLKQEIDFTNQTASLGITVDY